ncbi:MAG: HAMP domain-containing histidine kinase [Chloroflexi bacterium]|nr:HAMP domain-containing histidine kinase [Chloroflexota bacterium]MBV9598556.1 HAMP domain-containing histidine kinase [Chloroflexota bacterium]
MSARLRLALTTAAIVLLALVAFELAFAVEVLTNGDPADDYLVVDRAPRALLLGVIAAGSGALLAGWLGGRVLQGMTSVVATAAEMTVQGDFSRRLTEDQHDLEAAELTRTFNQLIERVDRVLAAQRQLMADTSHELRTPLTTISGNLELLGGALPESERAEVLRETRQEVARLTRLVRDLLLLAEIGETVSPERVDIRLDHLVNAVVDRLLPSEAVRVQVVDEPVLLVGDPERLEQVVSNLLNNALRYASSRPGAVCARVEHMATEARLTVEDDGPGLPADAVERIFDRFTRLDRARSRAHGGAGLGLAIVRHVAEAHGGRAWAENRREGGARFCVRLPAQPCSTRPLQDPTAECSRWSAGADEAACA